MNLSIFSYAGNISQTGIAVTNRYPKVKIDSYSDFEHISTILKNGSPNIAVPVWNSHEGEIRKANVWEHVLEERACLVDLWPGRIEFWLVTRRSKPSEMKRICSVIVAQKQCSIFLKRFNAEFCAYPSTVAALEAFVGDETLDAVLIAPNQIKDQGTFKILEKKTANPNNFTTFALLIPRAKRASVKKKKKGIFTAVSMPAFKSKLDDDQKEFFERLLDTSEDLIDVPRLLFVFNRVSEAASVGLLFQGPLVRGADVLTADIIDKSIIKVVEEAGDTRQEYIKELDKILTSHFPKMQSGDFVKHRGDKAWLFACPLLGIYTHGYDENVVEPAFRYYVNKVFKLLNRGIKCTSQQMDFFKKHQKAWQKNDSGFIDFTIVA